MGVLRPAAVVAVCGDCSGDGFVTVAELAACEAVLHHEIPLSNCPGCSCSGDGMVTEADIMQIEANAGVPTDTPAPQGSITASPPPTSTPKPTALVTITPAPTGAMTSAPTTTPTTNAAPCIGDCKGNRRVDISDLILGIDIALGTQDLSVCPAFDCMGNRMVTVSCLIQGVNDDLDGCP